MKSSYHSDRNPLHLIQRDLIPSPIIQLGRPRAFMRGDRLRVFDCSTILEVGSDARGSEGVAAGGVGETGCLSPPLDHAQNVIAAQRILGELLALVH